MGCVTAMAAFACGQAVANRAIWETGRPVENRDARRSAGGQRSAQAGHAINRTQRPAFV